MFLFIYSFIIYLYVQAFWTGSPRAFPRPGRSFLTGPAPSAGRGDVRGPAAGQRSKLCPGRCSPGRKAAICRWFLHVSSQKNWIFRFQMSIDHDSSDLAGDDGKSMLTSNRRVMQKLRQIGSSCFSCTWVTECDASSCLSRSRQNASRVCCERPLLWPG